MIQIKHQNRKCCFVPWCFLYLLCQSVKDISPVVKSRERICYRHFFQKFGLNSYLLQLKIASYICLKTGNKQIVIKRLGEVIIRTDWKHPGYSFNIIYPWNCYHHAWRVWFPQFLNDLVARGIFQNKINKINIVLCYSIKKILLVFKIFHVLYIMHRKNAFNYFSVHAVVIKHSIWKSAHFEWKRIIFPVPEKILFYLVPPGFFENKIHNSKIVHITSVFKGVITSKNNHRYIFVLRLIKRLDKIDGVPLFQLQRCKDKRYVLIFYNLKRLFRTSRVKIFRTDFSWYLPDQCFVKTACFKVEYCVHLFPRIFQLSYWKITLHSNILKNIVQQFKTVIRTPREPYVLSLPCCLCIYIVP